MKINRWFIIIFFVYLIGFFSHAIFLKKTVYGDGIFYYSWLRSITIDHDINFQNEYDYFQVTQPATFHGTPGNKYAIGEAIVWLPVFSFVNTIIRGKGYEWPYQYAVGLTSTLFTLTGLVLLFRLLSQTFSPLISIFSILAISFTTNLFFYGSLDPVNSHGLSFFAACLFLIFLFSKHKNYFFIGASLGILGIIRTQDIIYGLLLIPLLRSAKRGDIMRQLFKLCIGFIIVFLPQLAAWQTLYGKFWISPYLSGTEGFTIFEPHILEVLFSPKSGLLFWTPVLLLGFVGLFKQYKSFLFIIVLQLYIVASWSTWWQGASYGGRMFISVLPLFAFGIAYIFQILKRYHWNENYFLLIIIAPLGMLNMLFIISFLLKN